MTYILGLNAFHWDSSACLLKDGQLIAALAEERLGERIKHKAGFPGKAIKAVLEIGGIAVKDVDYLALGYDKNANSKQKMAYAITNPRRTAKLAIKSLGRRSDMSGLEAKVAEACGVPESDCRFRIEHVEHHLAHIASSFYCSNFDTAAGFSYDAAGDFVSAMYARCQGTDIEVLDRVFLPHSLGYFYTALCEFIGFDHIGEEYKVMGLSAYGEPKHMDLMREMLYIDSGGQFKTSEKYLKLLDQGFDELAQENGEFKLPPLYTDALRARLGPPRIRGQELTQRDMDIASSCQKHFENVVVDILNWLHTVVPGDNIVTAGGCSLNGVTNARILRDTPFKNSYIQCAASDDGLGIGAALWLWNCKLGKQRAAPVTHAYLGLEHSESEMEQALQDADLAFEKLEMDSVIERTAIHLNQGHIVGWYQGRCEWGPRALGNRSILAHPGWPDMKELINRKIKRRESFRPFAPSILADEVRNWFEQDVESPFMMHVVRISEDKREELAAVCHKDFTGRVHTVKRSQNRLYYDLIRKFSEKSGIPVLLNTSFNENEPIVDTPEQAVACFVRNDIDVLVMGPYITTKPGKTAV
ncbi:MAG TPA: carbamoyltransferase [Gammaproteobacteria bacterium]|nr:carbamoyltransferase [Gammaproteobacteria bacterium]